MFLKLSHLCWQDGHDSEDTKQSTADMTAFVSIPIYNHVWSESLSLKYASEFDTIYLLGFVSESLDSSYTQVQNLLQQMVCSFLAFKSSLSLWIFHFFKW